MNLLSVFKQRSCEFSEWLKFEVKMTNVARHIRGRVRAAFKAGASVSISKDGEVDIVRAHSWARYDANGRVMIAGGYHVPPPFQK